MAIVEILGERCDIKIRRGSDLNLEIELENDNGTPFLVAGSVIHTILRTVGQADMVFTTVLVDGLLTLKLTDTQTTNMVADRWEYTVELVDAQAQDIPLMFGAFQLVGGLL